MSLSKGSNRNTAKETHLNERNFDSFNTNNNERDALTNLWLTVSSTLSYAIPLLCVSYAIYNLIIEGE